MTIATQAPSLTDRISRMLAECEEEIGAVSTRRTSLLEQRDEELRAVKERYAAEIAELDEQIRVAERLKNALDPKPRTPSRKASPAASKRPEIPAEHLQLKVLQALVSGARTRAEIADVAKIHPSSLGGPIEYLREIGEVRMTGYLNDHRNPAQGGRKPAAFAATPDGAARLQSLDYATQNAGLELARA